jgi:hypothetical protein
MGHLSPYEIAAFTERMAQRHGKTLRRFPETAELTIDALHFCARMRARENPLLKVERWDWRGGHLEEIVARRV